jgi:hypothetical protein
MRFYSIKFSAPKGRSISPLLNKGPIDYTLFTSHPVDKEGNFRYNPGCPEVYFEVTTAWAHMITTPFHLQIKNIPAELLQYAKLYNNLVCEISAGFSPGSNYGGSLPLEIGPEKRSGVICVGYVQNCFGNWIGTNLVMDFLIYPSPLGSPSLEQSGNDGYASPQDMTFTWEYNPDGTYDSLRDKLAAFLGPRFGVDVIGKLNPKLAPPPRLQDRRTGNIYPNPLVIDYTVFDKFAEKIRSFTVQSIDPDRWKKIQNNDQGAWQGYRGVSMLYNFSLNAIILWDGTDTVSPGGTQLQYQDFIGQPTWTSSAGTVQSVHPMRNDFQLGELVKYPAQIPQIQSTQYAATGNFAVLNASGEQLQIQMVRHVGRYRDTSADAWATFLNVGPAVRYDPGPPVEEI